MNLALVDDDHLQADWVRKELEAGLGDVNIMMINTESEFQSRLEEIAKVQPAIIIMDVMLRWADPKPGLELPENKELPRRFRRAGLRCAELLQTRQDTKNIPVALYTVLEESDFGSDLMNAPSTVVHLEKDSRIEPLLDLIRQLTHLRKEL